MTTYINSSYIKLIFFCRKDNYLTVEDLSLLCDLFYLPFEHGGQGLQLLQEFNWLKSNAHLVIEANQKKDRTKPEVHSLTIIYKVLCILSIGFCFRYKNGLLERKK